MANEFYKKLVMGEAVNSFFLLATKPLTLVNSFVTIGILSFYEFGIYKLVISFQGMVSGFSINFLDNLVLNEMNVCHGEKCPEKSKSVFREYVWAKLIVGGILTTSVFFLADLISTYYGEDIAVWIRIISFLFLVENIKSLIIIFLQYRLNFFLSSFYTFAYEGIKLVLIFLLYRYREFGVTELLFLSVFTHILVIPFMLPAVIRGYVKKEEDDGMCGKTGSLLWLLMKRCGGWTVARYYLLNFSQNIRPWLIKWFLGVEAVAIFSVAVSFLGSLKSLISFNSLKVYLPRELGNEEKMKAIVIRGGRYITYIFVGIFISGTVAVPLAIHFFFPKYGLSLPYFYIISISMLFFGVSTITGQILYSLRRQKELFFTALAGLVSTVFFSVLLAPRFGLYGIAGEFLFTQIAVFLLSYALLLKNRPDLRFSLRGLFVLDEYDKIFLRKWVELLKIKAGHIF